ncbi:putative F-box/LRR-repeat protein At1g56400 [Lotus japonicus]|uniref:putative F-box/LRR-repeat protein At1g56400 n=1 Tax=Lotus japonicus TaxID=34305 RepID=UPI0025859AF2|nr:putative F-box/LRR-repeat protein At1g56400 [Lotus japonicus]
MAPSTDMLSLLPHSLLSMIVSLIPFKEAVRTSILSKSWIDIFKCTSNIEFDEVFFVKDDKTCQIRQAQRKDFLEFVTLWISNHRETLVDKFSLKLSMPGIAKRVVRKCIVFATNHKVKELELDFCDPTLDCYSTTNYINQEALFELPAHVYSHTCLESLKLFSCNFVETEFLNFHALKEISLGWMEVKLSTIKTLLSNCGALESLSLKRCWNSDDFDLGEENPRLRKLVVDRCMFRSNGRYFIVNAPNLGYFYYSGLNNDSLVINIRSLVMEEEVLDFCIEYEGRALFLYKLLENISGVRALTVGNYFLQVVPTGGCFLRMPRSLSVRSLIMKTSLDQNEFLGITFLLNTCSELEHLIIELGLPNKLLDYELPDNFNPERFWTDHARAYCCLPWERLIAAMREFDTGGSSAAGERLHNRQLQHTQLELRRRRELPAACWAADVAEVGGWHGKEGRHGVAPATRNCHHVVQRTRGLILAGRTKLTTQNQDGYVSLKIEDGTARSTSTAATTPWYHVVVVTCP